MRLSTFYDQTDDLWYRFSGRAGYAFDFKCAVKQRGVLFSKNGAQAGLGGSWRALELVGESLFVVKTAVAARQALQGVGRSGLWRWGGLASKQLSPARQALQEREIGPAFVLLVYSQCTFIVHLCCAGATGNAGFGLSSFNLGQADYALGRLAGHAQVSHQRRRSRTSYPRTHPQV